MASNPQKLAAQLRDIYTAGFPDAEARLSTPRALLLVTQVAAGEVLVDFLPVLLLYNEQMFIV